MARRRKVLVFRGGKVHVMARQCDSCIGFPRVQKNLAPGRAQGMLAQCVREDGCVPCHERMDGPAPAVCRWLFDQREKPSSPLPSLQIAARLGMVEYDA